MSRPRYFWVVGGGIMSQYMIAAAQRAGLPVVVSDRDMHCPGASQADLFVQLSSYDVQSHAAEARRHALCGVACCGADCAPTVAAIAAACGLPGIPRVAAEITHNKLLVRHTLAQLPGLFPRQLSWCLVHTAWSAEMALDAARQHFGTQQLPFCVLKPLRGRASRGVSCVHTPAQFPAAWARLQASADSEYALLEEGVTGTEHSAEIIFNADRQPCYFNLCDRRFLPPGLVPLEVGHINPTALAPDVVRQAYEFLLSLSQALGVSWGPFKADLLRDSSGNWWVLECAARLSGGFDSQLTVPLSSGRRPVDLVVQLATGASNPPCFDWQQYLAHLKGPYAACVGIFPQQGTLRHVPTAAQIAAVRGTYQLAEAGITAGPGQVFGPVIQHCAERIGFVFAAAPTSELAWRQATQGAQALQQHFVYEEEV